jgi:5-methylthioadenosine/S-adenosylhomocysteine deaminase
MEKRLEEKLPLINAHAHAAMVAFRGAGEDLPLDKWLKDVIWPLEAKMVNPDFVYEQTKIAIDEMRGNGIEAFMDMYFFEDSVARACEEKEMPVVLGEGLIDLKGEDIFNKDLERTIMLLEKYKDHSFIKVSVAPHSPYTVSELNLIKAKRVAKDYDCPYQIHVSETKKEFEESFNKYGLSPIEYLERIGVLDDKTVLVHCVFLTDKDISIIAKNNCKVVHCPISNLKLGCGIAPIDKLIRSGVVVALGTDGSASCDNLDIREAGRIASYLQKGINCDPTVLSKKEVIKMMTINGMKALQIENVRGITIKEIEKEIEKAY